jgi:hypothetical protein
MLRQQLGRAFERRKIVWRNAQRLVVSLQRPAVVTEPCKCNALQGPESGIARGVPQLRVRQLQRLSIVSRPERRLDFLGWVAARSALRKSRTNQQQSRKRISAFGRLPGSDCLVRPLRNPGRVIMFSRSVSLRTRLRLCARQNPQRERPPVASLRFYVVPAAACASPPRGAGSTPAGHRSSPFGGPSSRLGGS